MLQKGNIPGAEPEQDHRVELVGVRNGKGRQHEEKNDVAQNEVGGKITQLGDLAQEFTSRLGHGVPTHTVPFAGPPSDVRLVVLKLTGQGKRDNELVNEALNSHGRNHAGDGSGPAEGLQNEQDLEENQQHNDRNSVSDGR